MRQKTSIEIFTYWEQLRGADDAPLRTLIQPAAVRHILSELFILEAMPSGAPRFRLAGTTICGIFGRELRGENFAALWSGSQPDDPVQIGSGVMAHVVPTLINATGYSMSGRHMSFEMTLMPLRSSATVCDRLLGCLTPVTHAGWLGSERLEFLALDRSRLLQERPARTVDRSPRIDVDRLMSSDRDAGFTKAIRRVLNLQPFGRQQTSR